jgi:mono/diheme cytochrome c family protein
MKKFVTVAVTVALVLAFAPALFADATPDGASIYKAKCAMCHGADGKGKTPLTATAQKDSVEEIAKIVADGKKPKMPSYQGKLSAEEIKAVSTFVKSLK